MAISQVTRGVFLVSPDATKRFEDTLAGQLTGIYTKGRHDRWELAQKQAGLEYKTEADRYEEEMKAYRDRAKALNDQLKAGQNLLAKVGEGALKAEDAAKIKNAAVQQKEVEAQARRQEKVAEKIPVSQGGTSQGTSTSRSSSTGTSGGGGTYGGVSSRDVAADDEQIGLARQEAGSDPVNLANNVDSRTNIGLLSQTNPARADRARYGTVNTSIEAEKARLRADYPDEAPDVIAETAEATVLKNLKDGGRVDFVDGYNKVKSATAAPTEGGGGGGARSSESTSTSQRSSVNYGAELELKYPGLAANLPLMSPERQQAVADMLDPADRAKLLAEIKDRNAIVARELAGLERPTLTAPDFITRSREVYRGRFGPTLPNPAYEQRNTLEKLTGLDEGQRQQFLDAYRKHAREQGLDVVAPAPAPAAMPAPVAAPESGGTPTYEPLPGLQTTRTYGGEGLPPEPLPGLQTSPTYGGEGLPPEPLPGLQVQPTQADFEAAAYAKQVRLNLEAREAEARRQQVAQRRLELEALIGKRAQDTEQINSMLAPLQGFNATVPTADLRAPGAAPTVARPTYTPPSVTAGAVPSMAARLAAPPVGMGVRPEGVLPPPIPTAGPSAADAAPRTPVYGTPEARAMLRKESETPGMVTGGTDLAIRRAEKAAAEQKQKADEAAVKGKGALGAPPKDERGAYFIDRADAATALKDQPNKLKRLAASGAGKVGYQIYTTNKASGFAFMPVTWSEIVNTFAGDPEAMKKAHEVALAAAMVAHDSLTPKA